MNFFWLNVIFKTKTTIFILFMQLSQEKIVFYVLFIFLGVLFVVYEENTEIFKKKTCWKHLFLK